MISEVISTRADLVPGFILSKPGVGEIAAAESAFTARYLDAMAKGVASLPRDVMIEVMRDCARDVIMQNLAYGKAGFDIWARVKSSLPLLTFLSARIKHGDKVTMEMVATWLESPEAQKIADGVWQLWGYDDNKKKPDGASEAPAAQSTGSESSSDSPSPPPTASESPPSSSST